MPYPKGGPAPNPQGRPVNPERIAEYKRLKDIGYTREQIAREFGIQKESLERWLLRRGLT